MIALYKWKSRCYLIHIKYVYLQYYRQNTSDMRENLLRSDNKKGFFFHYYFQQHFHWLK